MAHSEQSGHHEGGGEPGGLNVATIAVVGAVGTMLVVIIVLAVEAWLAGYRDAQVGALRHDQPDAAMQEYRREQREKLNELGWVEGQEGNVAKVPIGRAMEIYSERRIELQGE